MARMTLDEIRAVRPHADRARIEATDEAKIAQQMIEDGEDPQADLGTCVEDWQPARIRARLGMSLIEFAAAFAIPAMKAID